jgi:hypothetical protein
MDTYGTHNCLPDPQPIATLPYRAHPCAQCGAPCHLHALCPACRPLELCDYCDLPAVPGDPDHACADCRAVIDAENAPERAVECRGCGEPTAPRLLYDGELCGRCVPCERDPFDVQAQEAGVNRWGPI